MAMRMAVGTNQYIFLLMGEDKGEIAIMLNLQSLPSGTKQFDQHQWQKIVLTVNDEPEKLAQTESLFSLPTAFITLPLSMISDAKRLIIN
ncbi:unnamed protein product [Paramecium octaurelia]|uniref:Uncharacterized protein n=1 Tax=Paramecium octaurelia TaxID=43137 RepID=A0A8S1XQ37_PAROT|nr:unnamed protein product [Paramecium octaurelia]